MLGDISERNGRRGGSNLKELPIFGRELGDEINGVEILLVSGHLEAEEIPEQIVVQIHHEGEANFPVQLPLQLRVDLLLEENRRK